MGTKLMAYTKGTLGLFLGLFVGIFFSKLIAIGLASGLHVFGISLSLDTWKGFQGIFTICFGIYCGIANYNRHLNSSKSNESNEDRKTTELE